MQDRVTRLASTVGRVIAEALRNARAERLILLDDGSGEAELAARWCGGELPCGSVLRVRGPRDDALESHLQVVEEVLGSGETEFDNRVELKEPGSRTEIRRLIGRLLASRHHGLVASPVNRTVALLESAPIPEPLLPLGDLWASRVAELTGSWSGPPHVRRLAEACGGIQDLDAALTRWARRDEGPEPARAGLSRSAHAQLSAAIESARFARTRVGLIPKLGDNTAGIDLSA